MNFNNISKNDYFSKRYELIKLLEESGHEEPELYTDDKGLITIGVGFNLDEDFVLEAFLNHSMGVGDEDLEHYKEVLGPKIESLRGKSTSVIQDALDSEWQSLTGDPNSEFKVVDGENKNYKEKIKETFDELAIKFEGTLENRLASEGIGGLSGGDHSMERLALISLEWNNGNELIPSSGGLIGALQNEDRFEAWYQIRYVSNGDEEDGIAKRRYIESEIFGLYDDPDNVSDEDAKHVVDSFLDSSHFNRITSYEAQYGHMVEDAVSDSGYNVKKLDQIFRPIAGYIAERFADDGEFDLSSHIGGIDGAVVLGIERSGYVASLNKGDKTNDKSDLLVATDGQAYDLSGRFGDDLIIGSNLDNKIYGGEDGDLLIGKEGKDTLYGGTGEDKLYGGSGSDKLYAHSNSKRSDEANDELYGGEGKDHLYGDAGKDLLEGGSGEDTLYGGTGEDKLYGGSGSDKLYAHSNSKRSDAVSVNVDVAFKSSAL